MIYSTNALGAVTTNIYGYTTGGQSIQTTINPDGGTQIQVFYQDGTVQTNMGTAVESVHYVYGVDSASGPAQAYTQEIKQNSSQADTSEWVKNYTDMVGRPCAAFYPDSSHSSTLYNALGQMVESVDQTGITHLWLYDPKGQQAYSALSYAQNNTIQFTGGDNITWTTNFVTTDHGTTVRVTQTYDWPTIGSGSTLLVSETETSVDGLNTWTTNAAGLATITITTAPVGGSSGGRTVTTTNPDGSTSISQYANGRLISMTRKDSMGNPIGATTNVYDPSGRIFQTVDARNGATTLAFNRADQVVTNTTPNPGGGGSAQVTVTAYDAMGRVLQTTLPDGGVVTNQWALTGQLLATGGARSYPVSYSYDYAGRMASMSTWTNYAGAAGAATTSWYYDTQRGWLTNKVYADGHGTKYGYYSNGLLSTRSWARGITTTYLYDLRGDLTNVYYSDGVTPGITNSSIDRLQRVATVYDGVASPRAISYNVLNQATGETYSGNILNGLEVTNAFDSLYRPSGVGAGIAGTQYQYGYDNASRLASVSDGTYSANYSYLANSPLVSQILFKQSSATRMTTTKYYDYLNRMTSVASVPASGATPWSFGYSYNSANQRTQINQTDGSHWNYGYDALGQVTSGYRYWADGTPVAGEQFQYGFDTIGNRTSTLSGGDQNGNNLRAASYAYNSLNEYTSRTVPGGFDVLGQANASASVMVNGVATYRHDEFYQSLVTVTNGSGPVWQSVTVAGTAGSLSVTNAGHILVHPAAESFWYDLDGNLLSDGCWTNTWDGENRLIAIQSVSAVPTNTWKKLNFAYDYMGRRTRKIVSTWNGSAYAAQSTNIFLYDGWNLIAELNGANNSLIRSYIWGTDLSGSMQGREAWAGCWWSNSPVPTRSSWRPTRTETWPDS